MIVELWFDHAAKKWKFSFLRKNLLLPDFFDQTIKRFLYYLLKNSVQVRRTDKINTEASLHNLEEYMKHVEAFYDKYELIHEKKVERTVFLATDEVKVLNEALNETR